MILDLGGRIASSVGPLGWRDVPAGIAAGEGSFKECLGERPRAIQMGAPLGAVSAAPSSLPPSSPEHSSHCTFE